MEWNNNRIGRFSADLADAIDGTGSAAELVEAVSHLFPCEAAFCVANRKDAPPVHLADTYPDGSAKEAVQRYVRQTYVLNPLHNAICDGLGPGFYRMSELASKNRVATTADVISDDKEEIGYRTPGWPDGLQETALLVQLSGTVIGEISFARTATAEGTPQSDIDRVEPFLPLIEAGFRKVWAQFEAINSDSEDAYRCLDTFGLDVLSPRESEIVQMILKGYSSPAIGEMLNIALPTVKTHRRNAYAKLGINTQQQLFNAFLQSL